CSAMESFVVGNSITKIGENAFSDCTALKDFTTEAVNPPYCGSQALQDIDKWKCKLYVPDESIDLYQTANQWKDFLFIE
ncbi:MAG: leucine-rich repeat domain-containing protein, partial [Muribaculaceae bacterium]|nr:leucine-rich repeat domain-containing protein [Muribaculaceae bacterium]